MRFPSIPTLIRTFQAFTTTTFRSANRSIYNSPQRATLVRSMPNIPFLGALFGTKMADSTQYPVQKTEGEWQAQLSPGMSHRASGTPLMHTIDTHARRAIPNPP